jgi:hypothetical protein
VNAGRLFGVLVALVAAVAGWELITAPSPRLPPNKRITDATYDLLMPGMSAGQIETLLGLPHTVEGGEIVRVQEPDAPDAAYEIQAKRRAVGDDILHVYEGFDHECIRVLLSANDHRAIAVEYCVDDVPVLYKGQPGLKGKRYSAMSIERTVLENPEQREHARRIVSRRALRGISESGPGPKAMVTMVRKIGGTDALPLAPPPPPPPAVPSEAGASPPRGQ